MKTDIVEKCLLFNAVGKVLLLRRSGTDVRRPHQWDLPGGLWEEDESLEEGVIREIAEESGITVQHAHVFFSKTEGAEWVNDYGVECKKNVVRIYYAAHCDSSSVVLSHEHSEYRWVTLQEASDLIEYPRHKEVVEYVIDNQLEI